MFMNIGNNTNIKPFNPGFSFVFLIVNFFEIFSKHNEYGFISESFALH